MAPDAPGPPSAEEMLAAFPVAKLNKLEELISNPRWVIPVLPGAELEVLLDAATALAREGLDRRSEPCQRFYREGLLVREDLRSCKGRIVYRGGVPQISKPETARDLSAPRRSPSPRS